jgi:hypothetical protein
MAVKKGSAEAIKEIVKLGRRISVPEMIDIDKAATTAGGAITSIEPDDDWCGTGRIHFPYPIPKREEFLKLLDHLAAKRINFEVLINGIPVPDHIIMNVSRQTLGF